jgi:gas vesicle protein
MRGRFITGLAAGAIIGAAAGLLMMPQMDMRTRRRVGRVSKRLVNRAEDMLDDLKDMTK